MTAATSLYYMFDSASSFTGAGLENWNVATVKDMVGTFRNTAVFNGDVSGWTTTSALDLSLMFELAVSFDKNLAAWDTSKVQKLVQTFSQATAFTGTGLGSWDVRSVTNLSKT